MLERKRDSPGPWVEAAVAAHNRDFVQTAEISTRMGARNAETEARTHAARTLLEIGGRAATAAQATGAVAFYRTVGASRLIHDA